MIKIDSNKLEHAYKQLLFETLKNNPDCKVSFRTGLWEEKEGYKRYIWEDARAAMAIDTWPEHRDNPDYIVQKAIQAFGIKTRDTCELQNLVSPPNYNSFFDMILLPGNMKKVASSIYNIFYGTDDHMAFDQLAQLTREKCCDPISINSYFFFLKDQAQFVPAKKIGTIERMKKLGISGIDFKLCTWDSYIKYLDIIGQIHKFLLSHHPEATFLDAQSFLWMLHRINSSTPEYSETLE